MTKQSRGKAHLILDIATTDCQNQ